MSASSNQRLAIVVKGFPRLSETFIARELEALERSGLDFSLHALRNPGSDASLTDYRVNTPCSHLPEYLHHAPLLVMHAVLAAIAMPGFSIAWRLFLQDIKRDFSRARLRRFGQACVLAQRLGGSTRHIHAHFAHSPTSVVRYCARLLGIGYSISAHAKDVWTDPEWDLRAKLSDAKFVFTCNRAAFERLAAITDPGKLHLAYHGIDLKLLAEKPIRQFRDGSDKTLPLQIISVARAVEKKGLRVLLEALSKLPENLHFRLDHYGDGELMDSLRVFAKSLGISHHVTFHGAQPHERIIAAMDGSDLFVFPALVSASGDRDGIPNSLIEANARGLCVVASDSGSTFEVVKDGVTGVLVRSGDATALAQAIEACAKEPQRREAFAKTALELNSAVFDGSAGYYLIFNALKARLSPA